MNSQIVRKLEALVALRAASGAAPMGEQQVLEQLVQPLFQELGWGIGQEVETVDYIGLIMPLATNSQPLMLLKPMALQVPTLPRDRLSKLLGYAYNRNADWTVVTNFDHLDVYQTRWLNAHTKATPSLDLLRDTYVSQPDRLSMLTPDSVATGHTARVLGARDHETLLPVHELLFRHFQRWRQELLTYGYERPGINLALLDQEVQHFFNQLIFLRSLEDTGRLTEHTLRSVYQTWASAPPRTNLKKGLENLVQALGKKTGSDLFRWPEILDFVLTDQLLQGIIEGLYRAGLTVPIDFGLIKADILGGMYEHFLSYAAKQRTEEELRTLVQSPRLIPEPPITVADVRKERGIYFTPPSLAEYITTVSCEAWYGADNRREGQIPTVLDFACGSGTFLVEALQYLMRRIARDKGLSRMEASREVVSRLLGVDISQIAADDTVANLLHASMLPLDEVRSIQRNIRVGNSLITRDEQVLRDCFGLSSEGMAPISWEEMGPASGEKGRFDIILSNPPFKSTEQMQHGALRTYFKDQYQVARGRWDQAFLFLELALRLVNEDGVIGMVMPASVLKSESGAAVRRLIEERNALFSIVDFTDRSVFAGVSTYITLIFLKPNWSGGVKYIEVQEFPETETGRSWFFHHLMKERMPPGFLVSTSEADKPQAKGAPWVIVSPRERKLKEQMELKGHQYPATITVDQGVKTGLNEAFLVDEVARETSGYVVVKTSKGIRTIESRFLQPAALGEHISRYSLSPELKRIIYPYRDDGSVVPENLLRGESERLWEYLNEWRDELTRRRSFDHLSGPWYSFIRPRGTWIHNPKVLGPDYAQQCSFAFDQKGEIIPVGGNAIVSSDLDLRVVIGILNSSLINWYITRSSVRRRGSYFAFYGRFIQSLPLVNVSMLPNAAELQKLIVERVDRILSLHDELNQEARSDMHVSQLASELAKIDRELDELVLHLYEAYEYQDVVWGQ